MRRGLRVYMWPIWLIALFGQAKSFKANPLIGSSVLNRLGLHALRYVSAHAVAGLRWWMLRPLIPKAERQRFHRDGFLEIRDFLTKDEIAAVRAELVRFDGPVRQMTQGDTRTQRILMDKNASKKLPSTAAILRRRRLNRLFGYTSAKWERPMLYVQRIRNGDLGRFARNAKAGASQKKQRRDPQKTLHSDTFHPTMKAWLFLEDVTPDMGPFTYVPGSHRLTRKRLAFEYKTSVRGAGLNDGYSEKGSLRLTEAASTMMDIKPPLSLAVPAGTLVLANTHGFHGRGQAEDGQNRLELWAYSRHNPFNPWPGLGLNPFEGVKNLLLERFLRYKDREAAKRGSRASWHPIDAPEMLGDLADTASPGAREASSS